jgi:hypothetical protein
MVLIFCGGGGGGCKEGRAMCHIMLGFLPRSDMGYLVVISYLWQ